MVTAVTTSSNGHRSAAPPPAGLPRPPGRPPGVGRRRQLPRVAVGVLLVLGCALAFADASLRLGAREQVLALARPVTAGHVLTGADLRVVRLSAGPGLPVIPAGAEGSVLGRPAALPLAAGTLLTTAEIGSGSGVPAGFDVVAVGLKPGAYPPGLAAGDHIQVIPATATATATATAGAGPAGAGSPVSAVVLGVQSGSATAGTQVVFSLQVDQADAAEVASLAAAGQASVIQVGG